MVLASVVRAGASGCMRGVVRGAWCDRGVSVVRARACVEQAWCKRGVFCIVCTYRSVVRACACVEQAWCKCGVLCIVCTEGRTHTRKSRQSKRESQDRRRVTGTYVGISVTDTQTDGDRVKEVLASWSTSNRIILLCLTFFCIFQRTDCPTLFRILLY